MKQDNTKRRARRLNAEIAATLRGVRGSAAQVAELAHVDHAHISRILSGHKPPSRKVLVAIDTVLIGIHSRVARAILRRTHPEVDE